MTDLNQDGKTLLDETMKANQAAGLKPQAIPAARKTSGMMGYAMAVGCLIAMAGWGVWWLVPRAIHFVGGAISSVNDLSDISRMGLWLCAAAVLHASCSRRK